jgi:hypothetical protein
MHIAAVAGLRPEDILSSSLEFQELLKLYTPLPKASFSARRGEGATAPASVNSGAGAGSADAGAGAGAVAGAGVLAAAMKRKRARANAAVAHLVAQEGEEFGADAGNLSGVESDARKDAVVVDSSAGLFEESPLGRSQKPRGKVPKRAEKDAAKRAREAARDARAREKHATRDAKKEEKRLKEQKLREALRRAAKRE